MLKVALDFFDSKDDAEDAVQEAMVQLWLYCERIDVNRNVEGLAVRVAKNSCVNHYRKQQAQKAPFYDNVVYMQKNHPSDSAATPQERLEAQDVQRMMDEVVALLKPRERQLFEMRTIMGLSTKEVSAQTGIPKASVASMVSTARKKVLTELRKRMKQ